MNVASSNTKQTEIAPPIFIWFDKNSTKKKFSSKFSIQLFVNRDECLEEIRQIKEKIFLILSSSSATDILSSIHQFDQIETIFLLCSSIREKQRCEYLRQHYSKIFDLFLDETNLFETIEQWTNLYQQQSANEYLRLGEEYQNKTEWNRAIQCTQRALIIYRKTLTNENHPLIARCLNNLGAIYDGQGDVNRSFEFYEKAIQIYAKLTPKNPSKQQRK